MFGYWRDADGRPALQLVKWFEGRSLGISRETMPLRTVYNPKSHEYEQIPLAQFQQMLRQGKIEEHETQSPYDGHRQRVYRLV